MDGCYESGTWRTGIGKHESALGRARTRSECTKLLALVSIRSLNATIGTRTTSSSNRESLQPWVILFLQLPAAASHAGRCEPRRTSSRCGVRCARPSNDGPVGHPAGRHRPTESGSPLSRTHLVGSGGRRGEAIQNVQIPPKSSESFG